MLCNFVDVDLPQPDNNDGSISFRDWKENWNTVMRQLNEKMDADRRESHQLSVHDSCSLDNPASGQVSVLDSSYSSADINTTFTIGQARKSRKTNIFPDDLVLKVPMDKPKRSALGKIDVNTMEVDDQSSSGSTPASKRSSLGLINLTTVSSLHELTMDSMIEHNSSFKLQKSLTSSTSAAGSRRTSLNSSAMPADSTNKENDVHRLIPRDLTFIFHRSLTLNDVVDVPPKDGELKKQRPDDCEISQSEPVLPEIVPGSVKTVKVLRARKTNSANKAVIPGNENLIKKVKFQLEHQQPSLKRTAPPITPASKRGMKIIDSKRITSTVSNQASATDINENKLGRKPVPRNNKDNARSTTPLNPKRSTRNLKIKYPNVVKPKSSSDESEITSETHSKTEGAPNRTGQAPMSKPSVRRPSSTRSLTGPRPPTPAPRRITRSRMTIAPEDTKPDSSEALQSSKNGSQKTNSRSAESEIAPQPLETNAQQTSVRKRITRSRKINSEEMPASPARGLTPVKRCSLTTNVPQSRTGRRIRVEKIVEPANATQASETLPEVSSTKTVLSPVQEEDKPKKRRSGRIRVFVTKVKRSRAPATSTPSNCPEGIAKRTRRAQHASDSTNSKPEKMCGLPRIRLSRKKTSIATSKS